MHPWLQQAAPLRLYWKAWERRGTGSSLGVVLNGHKITHVVPRVASS